MSSVKFYSAGFYLPSSYSGELTSHPHYFYNNIASSGSDGFIRYPTFGVLDVASAVDFNFPASYCVSSDATANGSNSLSNINVRDYLYSSGSTTIHDVRITNLAPWISSGYNLDELTWDIQGQTRGCVYAEQFNPDNDIGPDHLGSGASNLNWPGLTLMAQGIGSFNGDLNLYTTGKWPDSSLPMFVRAPCPPATYPGSAIIVDRIGSGLCDRFPDLSTWWAARQGTLVSSGLLVIAELQPQLFDAGASPNLTMSSAQTGPNNYYIIRSAPGYEFNGDFSASNIPTLTCQSGYSILCNVPYTRFENFVISDIIAPFDNKADTSYGISISSGIIDSVGIQRVYNKASGIPNNGDVRAYGIIANHSAKIYNCVVNDIYCQASGNVTSSNVRVAGIYAPGSNARIFNNTIANVSGVNRGGTFFAQAHLANARGVWADNITSNARIQIYNNLVFNVQSRQTWYFNATSAYSGVGVCYYDTYTASSPNNYSLFEYNAGSDNTASGTTLHSNSFPNITPSAHVTTTDRVNFYPKLLIGSYLRGSGTDLSAHFSDDFEGQPRGSIIGDNFVPSYDLGADQYGYGFGTTNPGFTLITSGGYSSISDTVPLSMGAVTPISSGMDLYISGPESITGGIDLYLSGPQTVSDGIDLICFNDNPAEKSLNLYLMGASEFSSMNLFAKVAPVPSGSVKFHTLGGMYPASGGNNNVTLFLMASGTTVTDSMPLFLKVDPTGVLDTTLPLFLNTTDWTSTGSGANSGNSIPLFAAASIGYPSGGMHLYLRSSVSGGTYLNLVTVGPDRATITDSVPFNITGEYLNGTMPLFLRSQIESGSLNLTLWAPSYPTTGSTPLTLTGQEIWKRSLFKTVPLNLTGTGSYSNINLFVKTDGVGYPTATIPLVVNNQAPSLSQNLALVLNSHTLYSGLNLYTKGLSYSGIDDETNDGWYISAGGMNLFINRATEGAMTYLYLKGTSPTVTSSGMHLFMNSIQGVLTSGLPMNMRSDPVQSLKLYTHGF